MFENSYIIELLTLFMMETYVYLKFTPIQGEDLSIIEKLNESDKTLPSDSIWIKESLKEHMASVREKVKKLTGRKLQDKTVAVRVGSVYVKDDTTKEDVVNLVNKLKKWKVDVFQFAIVSTRKSGNRKVILLADWIDDETGTSLKLSKNALSEIRNMTADVLGLEHGQTYKEKLERMQNLQDDIKKMEVVRSAKEHFRGMFGMSEKDKRIKQLEDQLSETEGELEKERKGKKELIKTIDNLKGRIKNLSDIIKSNDLVIKDQEKLILRLKNKVPTT